MAPPPADARAFAADLDAALGDGGEVAAVLVRTAMADPQTLERDVRSIAPIVQGKGAALVLEDSAELAVRTGADGAHLRGIDALKSALPILKPERIAGAGGLTTRHEAMLAGEAGADYVMFGEPDAAGRRPDFDAVVDRVTWWAELFEPPCVGFAASLNEVAALAGAGADFVAVCDLVWEHAAGPAAGLRAVAGRLRASAPNHVTREPA